MSEHQNCYLVIGNGTENLTIYPKTCSIKTSFCNEDLQHEESQANITLNYEEDIFRLLALSDKLDASIYAENGTLLFTGIINDTISWEDLGDPYPMESLSVTVHDYTSLLSKKTAGEFGYIDTELSAIVNAICLACGIIPKLSYTDIFVPAFVLDAETEFKSNLENLLFQYGFTYYFNADGSLSLFDFKKVPEEVSVLGDGQIFLRPKFNRQNKKYEKITVKFNTLTAKTNELVYFSGSGYNSDNTVAPAIVQQNVYFPFESSPVVESDSGQVFQSFESGYAESYKKYNGEISYRRSSKAQLVYSLNHHVVNDWEGGAVEIDRTDFHYRQSSVRLINRGASDAKVYSISIRADAWYRDSEQTVSIGSGSNEYKCDAEFIFESDAAETLARTLQKYFIGGKFKIEIKSDLELPLGSYYTLSSGRSGFTSLALIISRSRELETDIYTYTLITLENADITTVEHRRSNFSTPADETKNKIVELITGNVKDVAAPSIPVIRSVIATKDGISIECTRFGAGLANTIKAIDFYIRKKEDADWTFLVESSSLAAMYLFNRRTDGYPEYMNMSGWMVKAKAYNIYNKESEWSAPVAVNTDEYGTWMLQPPVIYPRINDRTITLKLSQPPRSDNRDVYGTLRYRVQVRRPDLDGENVWYKPSTSLNPYPVKDTNGTITAGNEENYKDGDGTILSDGTYIQTMPLNGQGANDIRDTIYQFRVIAENEAGTSTETVINATALCTNIKDIVAANEDFKELYITDLSALSANIGAILEGAFGDGANLWDLSTFIDKYGVQHYKGRMHVGGTEQYLHVDPVVKNGIPTGDYTISFKVGAFEITSSASKINGEFIVQINENSLDRTRITPTGTFYEHRGSIESHWESVAKQETRGLLSQILYSDKNLVISNMSTAQRRAIGHDIGKPYLSADGVVYHFDTDKLNQKGTAPYVIDSYEDPDGVIHEPVLVDASDNGSAPEGINDFTPAILSLAPYSEIGKSLYGRYSLSHPLNGNEWTCDFWIQYIWAENQTLFDIGNDTDRISIIISSGEPNYNEPLEGEPPYNYETVDSDSLVYNVTLGADNYIFHSGLGRSENIKLSDLGVKFDPNSWIHFAVVMSATKIKLYIGTLGNAVEFERYSATNSTSTAVFNYEKNSFCLDELYIDSVLESFESFHQSSLDKIPWGSLAHTERHFILDAADLQHVHTNLFDTELFRQKVIGIINKYQGENT